MHKVTVIENSTSINETRLLDLQLRMLPNLVNVGGTLLPSPVPIKVPPTVDTAAVNIVKKFKMAARQAGVRLLHKGAITQSAPGKSKMQLIYNDGKIFLTTTGKQQQITPDMDVEQIKQLIELIINPQKQLTQQPQPGNEQPDNSEANTNVNQNNSPR